MSNRNHAHTVSHRAKFAAVRGVPMLSVLPVLTYLVKDINDNAASARQCDPSNHPKVKQDPHVVSRQSNSVELRLAKVEETILKLLPMAQAFEAWLRANNQISTPGLPCVVCSHKDHVVSDFLASFTSFRIDPDSTTSNIQSPISRSPPVEDRPSTSTSYRASNAIKDLCVNDVSESSYTPRYDHDLMESSSSYGPEKWSDRYSHLSKDSYGQLRCYILYLEVLFVQLYLQVHRWCGVFYASGCTCVSPKSGCNRRIIKLNSVSENRYTTTFFCSGQDISQAASIVCFSIIPEVETD